MGPLEGVQDFLGVSQSMATTRAKDLELLFPALRGTKKLLDESEKAE